MMENAKKVDKMQKKKRILLKIGSNTLTKETDNISRGKIEDVANQIAKLKDTCEFIIVSSGAIAVAKQFVKLESLQSEVFVKQALASIGQPHLIRIYQEIFREYGLLSSQCLLSYSDFEKVVKYYHKVFDEIKKELGDLLFHLMFYSRLGKEKGWFCIDDIAETISNKMINRHPHVFSDNKEIPKDMNSLKEAWHQQKEVETQYRQEQSSDHSSVRSLMLKVSQALPAFIQAKKIQQQAARVGFDWSEAKPIVAKLKEEINELEPYETLSLMELEEKIETLN